MSKVKIILQSEEATSKSPATVFVYEEGVVVAEVVAEIEQKKGADGGLYPCVTLRKK